MTLSFSGSKAGYLTCRHSHWLLLASGDYWKDSSLCPKKTWVPLPHLLNRVCKALSWLLTDKVSQGSGLRVAVLLHLNCRTQCQLSSYPGVSYDQ